VHCAIYTRVTDW